MDDLRNQIRAAFERQQAAHPPAANLRHTVVRSVAARPVRQANLQWLAVAAALMIAVLVVASLVASRLHLNAPVNSHKPAVGEPPAGVSLVYVAELDHDGKFDAYDWNGKAAGSLTLPNSGTGISMSADGQEFVSGFAAKGGNFEFFDRLGHSLGTSTEPGAYGVIWADDNRSVCFMTQDPQTYEYTVWLEQAAQPARAVAAVARDKELGQSVLNVVACSTRNDSAIVVRTTIGWPVELWVVRLSDGSIVAHHAYGPQALGTIVASPDARYIAETSWTAFGGPTYPQNKPNAPFTVIRRVSDWAQMAHMDAGYAVVSFSGDGHSVLVRTQILTHGENDAIFAWSDDGSLRTVWQHLTPGTFIAESTSEPGGSSFAIAFVAVDSNNRASWCAPGLQGCTTALSVTIVHGDGTSVDIPGRYNPAW
jgi:hypothetical protein